MRVFLDANILIDIFDSNRIYSEYSKKAYEYLILNHTLFTSCDIVTTIYYIGSKIDKKRVLEDIRNINKTLTVIEFSNYEVEETCKLMLEDDDFKDLEDTMQYILAKKLSCDLIISNDKDFVSKDIELLKSREFCEKYMKKDDNDTKL